MSEALKIFFDNSNIRSRYLHSEIDSLERVSILRGLRLGEFDVLVGVNLLREGLDLPEVSLVIILDADKEGFLRNEKSLIQTSGRAARHVNGKVIMYADKVTKSMQATIDETSRRRKIQKEYNKKNNIKPKSVNKSKENILAQTAVAKKKEDINLAFESKIDLDPILKDMLPDEIDKIIKLNEIKMKKAAKDLDFFEAARLRDEITELNLLKEKN